MTTEVATTTSAEIDALIREQDDEFSDAPLQTPILKIGQQLTKEVKAGDAEAGEFINTLTGEVYGTRVEFIIARAQRGRAASTKDGRYFVAIGQDTFPESWADLVGEEFVGTPFSEYPDAEEQYKARVNAKEIEWGKGPLISTTYNYTGFVIPSPVEGSDEVPEPMPVRIAFLRSTKSAHDKIQTLKRATMRNKPIWGAVFSFETESKSFGRNDSFVVNVKKVRETTPEEQAGAAELALAVQAGRTTANEDAGAEGKAEPAEAKGALAV